MKDTTTVGMNRTGTALAPERTEEMIEGTREFPPSTPGDERAIAQVRIEYGKETGDLGSIPPPTGMKEMAKTAMKAVKGDKPAVLLDKLGERLAFERTGTRFYDALIAKHAISGGFTGGPTAEELTRIRDEELQHFGVLAHTIRRLGGDPTSVTPSADVAAAVSIGIGTVLTDPRTNLLQCLEAILIAELADNEGWDGALELARVANDDELVRTCEQAIADEREHLRLVRTWVGNGQGRNGARAAAATPAKAAPGNGDGNGGGRAATGNGNRSNKPTVRQKKK